MRDDPAMTTIFDGGKATARQLRKAKLVVVSGAQMGQEFELTRARVSGGRSPINEIVIQDKAVSGTHFEIITDDEGYRLKDLGSTNGTYVGDLRLVEVWLKPGTTFRVGHTELRFQPLSQIVEIALSQRDRFGRVLGQSVRMREVFAVLEKVAPSELTVLITGDTGTGKELVARSIHDLSRRARGPFVVLDCGAIPRDLMESTIFGHEKGSFTGATSQHRGVFEQAHGGTIFLDEIGELDLNLQPKLLRVLENREVKRVGGSQTIRVDVRVLAATNRDLRQMVSQGTFREDLYFRLSVIQAENPPLRERREDIPLLVHHFLGQASERRGQTMSIAVDAMSALMGLRWPGNVRELRNVVERAAMLADNPVITRADLALGREPAGREAPIPQPTPQASGDLPTSAMVTSGQSAFAPALFQPDIPFKDAKQQVTDEFERAYLEHLLDRHQGNITRAALEAGLTRYHLRELLKRHNVSGKGLS